MKVIRFFESDKREYWLNEIKKSDWNAGAFLYRLLKNDMFFQAVGADSDVLLLTDGDCLISFCTFAEKDDVQPTDLSPWIGFVYTFPEYRGKRYAGLLFDEAVRIAKEKGVPEIYLSTNHTGLYEKYGFEYKTQMIDMDGEPTKIYIRKTDTIAYCGVDCSVCPDYLNGTCVSCRQTVWKEDDICMPVRCCREKGIEFCAFCSDFPCGDMAEFYEESDGHREAYRRMRAMRKDA